MLFALGDRDGTGCAGDASRAGFFWVNGIFPPIGLLFDGKFHPLEPISTAAKGLDALQAPADTSPDAVGFPSLINMTLGA